jgi:hypothetical protein
MAKEFNKYWLRSLSLDEQESILLRDAKDETPFIKECIRVAMAHAKSQKPLTDRDLETLEALSEEL